jgi:hypothetical protein
LDQFHSAKSLAIANALAPAQFDSHEFKCIDDINFEFQKVKLAHMIFLEGLEVTEMEKTMVLLTLCVRVDGKQLTLEEVVKIPIDTYSQLTKALS